MSKEGNKDGEWTTGHDLGGPEKGIGFEGGRKSGADLWCLVIGCKETA